MAYTELLNPSLDVIKMLGERFGSPASPYKTSRERSSSLAGYLFDLSGAHTNGTAGIFIGDRMKNPTSESYD